MEQTVAHYPEIFVKDQNSMNFMLVNVLKDEEPLLHAT